MNLNKRNDVGFKFILENIIKNDRFRYYDEYIKLAKEKGYIITSYIDYLTNHQNSGKKILILRHDIDSITPNTKQMFEIEKNNNVKSTYYFRWNTIDLDLIKQLDKNGFEVGLHYETLALYCEKNNITKVDDNVLEKCRQLLKDEIKEFEHKTNVKVQTIASHGHPKNLEIGLSNNVLLEEEKYSDYHIISESYDKSVYKNVNTHIMDTNILYNYGFAYKQNPIESILKGDNIIIFLAHPDHWKYDFKTRIKMVIKLFIGKYNTSTNREFKRIDDKK